MRLAGFFLILLPFFAHANGPTEETNSIDQYFQGYWKEQGIRIAIIESKLTGELAVPEGKKDKSAKESWTKTEGRMQVELEIGTGRVLASRGEGKVHAYYAGIDPGTGDKTEVNVTFKTSGNYRARNEDRKTPTRKKDY